MNEALNSGHQSIKVILNRLRFKFWTVGHSNYKVFPQYTNIAVEKNNYSATEFIF